MISTVPSLLSASSQSHSRDTGDEISNHSDSQGAVEFLLPVFHSGYKRKLLLYLVQI